jgi:membrane associated rhomboid family serine protease
MEGPVGPATKILIAINVVLGLAMLSDDMWQRMVLAGGLFPIRFFEGSGGFEGFQLPVWVTPFSAAFLHGGLSHLLLNMVMLGLMGRFVENVYGWRLFVILYTIGIVASAFLEVVMAPSSSIPAIGASGAISAVVGVYVMLFPRKRPEDLGPLPSKYAHPLKLLLGWFAINFMMQFVGSTYGINIAIWSHIGGFIAGLLLARPFLRYRFRNA